MTSTTGVRLGGVIGFFTVGKVFRKPVRKQSLFFTPFWKNTQKKKAFEYQSWMKKDLQCDLRCVMTSDDPQSTECVEISALSSR